MTPLQQQSKDPDVGLHRRVIGFFLFPVALFPLLALLTYDWHRIPNLCIPVDVATSNLIGPLGDWFAYRGYQSIGLMVWSIPIILIFTGIHLLSDKPLNFGRKFVYAFFFLFTSACFLQLCGRSVVIAGMMHSLNIEPNAGGAIGYFMMTCFLAKFLSPFGAGIIMVTLSILFLLLMIGVRRIIRAIAGLFNWALGHTHTNPVESEEERAAREQVIRQAREAAKAQLEANRAAINAEKEDLKAKREAAKAAKEKARLQELAEKEAAKARLDAMNANAGIGSPSADVSPYIPTEEASVDPVKQFDLFGNEDPDAWLINRKRNVTKAPSHVKTSAPKPPPPASAAQNVAKAAEPTEKTAPVNDTPYVIPPIDILSPVPQSTAQHGDVAEMSQRLIDTLKVFDINARSHTPSRAQ